MATRKVTIEDISQKTGLSRGTVSRALNDRPDISQKTKQRVLEACRSLNYVPSHAARSLATGRNLAVVVLVDDLGRAFSAGFLRGVLHRAEEQHYGVYVVELGLDPVKAGERLRTLTAERIDAALVAAPLSDEQTESLRESIGARRWTSVVPLDMDRCDVVGPDLREAGRLAARTLCQASGNGLLCLHRGRDHEFADGAREVLREAGMDADGQVVEVSGEALPSAAGEASAIATSDDALAVSVYAALLQQGRAIGRDVHVIGCGNSSLGAALQPGLTTIELGSEEIGQRAMDIVLQRVTGSRQDGPQRMAIAPQLVRRGSIGG